MTCARLVIIFLVTHHLCSVMTHRLGCIVCLSLMVNRVSNFKNHFSLLKQTMAQDSIVTRHWLTDSQNNLISWIICLAMDTDTDTDRDRDRDKEMIRSSLMGGKKWLSWSPLCTICDSGLTRYHRTEYVTPSAPATPARTIWMISCWPQLTSGPSLWSSKTAVSSSF